MSKRRTPGREIVCRFCNKLGPESIEDVLPEWYARELRADVIAGGAAIVPPTWFGGTFEVKPDEPGTPTPDRPKQTPAMFLLSNVCDSCNGGWMSRLENAAKRTLMPLIRGKERSLSPRAQWLIARWGQLKWISVAALSPEERLPDSRAHHFFDMPDPLPDVEVHVGAYDFDPAHISYPFIEAWGVAHRARGAPIDHLRVTVIFKHLVVTIGGPAAEDPTTRGGAPHDAHLLKCWPEPDLAGLPWPPARLVTKDDLKRGI